MFCFGLGPGSVCRLISSVCSLTQATGDKGQGLSEFTCSLGLGKERGMAATITMYWEVSAVLETYWMLCTLSQRNWPQFVGPREKSNCLGSQQCVSSNLCLLTAGGSCHLWDQDHSSLIFVHCLKLFPWLCQWLVAYVSPSGILNYSCI